MGIFDGWAIGWLDGVIVGRFFSFDGNFVSCVSCVACLRCIGCVAGLFPGPFIGQVVLLFLCASVTNFVTVALKLVRTFLLLLFWWQLRRLRWLHRLRCLCRLCYWLICWSPFLAQVLLLFLCASVTILLLSCFCCNVLQSFWSSSAVVTHVRFWVWGPMFDSWHHYLPVYFLQIKLVWARKPPISFDAVGPILKVLLVNLHYLGGFRN